MSLLLALMISGAHATKTLQQCMAPGQRVVMDGYGVQDQDGLGTCYANAASLMMQITKGWKRPISYHQLAMIHAVDKNPYAVNVVKPTEKDLNFVGEGGWACRSFDAAKKYGFCEAETFRLDVHGAVDPLGTQADAIRSYGTLLDSVSAKDPTPEEWDFFTKALAQKMQARQRNCKGDEAGFIQSELERALPEEILKILSDAETLASTPIITIKKTEKLDFMSNLTGGGLGGMGPAPTYPIEQAKKVRDTLLVSEAVPGRPDVLQWRLNPGAQAELAKLIPGYVKTLGAKPKQQSTDSFFQGTIGAAGMGGVASPLAAIYMRLTSQALPGEVYKKDKTTLNVTRAYMALSNCGLKFDDTLAKSLNLEEMLAAPVCARPERLDPVVEETLASARDIVQRLKRQQSYGGDSLENRMKGFIELVAPACAAQMETFKRSIQDRDCESVVNNSVMTAGRKSSVLSGYKDTDPQTMVSYSRDWTVERLCNNKPVTVTVCTDFMSGPTIDTKFCNDREKSASGADKHGIHVMTVVGYERKADGKTRMLVQNSWGKSCPFKGVVPVPGKDVECELDANKEVTGRFWIDGDVLIKNSYDFSALTGPGYGQK